MVSRRFLSGLTLAAILAAATGLRVQAAGEQPIQTSPPEHERHMAAMSQARNRPMAPLLPGQDAFGAIQEIVHLLEADPATDWSKVDLNRLRQHLVDMNEVMLRANISETAVEGGIQATVTGDNRTLEAIRRMVPAQMQEIDRTQLNGWRSRTQDIENGVVATVTSTDPRQVIHLRGLGFIGVMVSGPHHQLHHVAMAQGKIVH